jgi:phage terminase large subunit-like protein
MGADQGELRRWLEAAAELDEKVLARTLASLTPGERATLEGDWPTWAHHGQSEPEGDWRVWVIRAGRGFGKTRAGAEWVLARVREGAGAQGPLQVALVAATLDEAVKVMVSGESGLIASARDDERPRWVASRRMLLFPSGAQAFAYSASSPDMLRGPQHHFAWCDELAKWSKADEAWDNLMLGLRLGTRPRCMVTTTPRPIALLKRIEALERATVTRGRTADNPHVAPDFQAAVTGMYAGTRLGRQELDGELIEDVEGALWTRDLIERCRVGMGTAEMGAVTFPRAHDREGEGPGKSNCPLVPLVRIVIGVDPPAGESGDACGIVVCGLGEDRIGYVLADQSAAGLSPAGWAARVAAAAEAWAADRVVAEANNGGKMVEAVLRGAALTLPVRLVHASNGKAARAEPVAMLFESGQAKFAGAFPALEDELCGLTAGGRYSGPGRSPDRADACVWALTELMLGKWRADPSVRGL